MIDQNSKIQTGIGTTGSGRFFMRFAAIVVSCSLLLGLAAACVESDDVPEVKPASYGHYGSDLAKELADRWPNRSPGSVQEKADRKSVV